jgi:DNA-binding NtrC family response regulator
MATDPNTTMYERYNLPLPRLDMEHNSSHLTTVNKWTDIPNNNIFIKEVLNSFIEYLFTQENIPLKDFLEELERTLIIRSLAKFNGNQKRTAVYLGIKTTTLHQKMKKYQIDFHKKSLD